MFKTVKCVTSHINGNRFVNIERFVRFVTDVIKIINTSYSSQSTVKSMTDCPTIVKKKNWNYTSN